MYICQNCGAQILSEKHFGTNYDNSVNRDFCSDCYRDGNFTSSLGDFNDFNFYASAVAFGQMGTDYETGMGLPIGVPYFLDSDE